jgi:predicted  nucleic acid-binding Zn-ribbon protein
MSRVLLVAALGGAAFSYYALHKDIYTAGAAVERTIDATNKNVQRVLNGSETLQHRVSDLESNVKVLQEQNKEHEATIISLTRRLKLQQREDKKEQPQEQPQPQQEQQ